MEEASSLKTLRRSRLNYTIFPLLRLSLASLPFLIGKERTVITQAAAFTFIVSPWQATSAARTATAAAAVCAGSAAGFTTAASAAGAATRRACMGPAEVSFANVKQRHLSYLTTPSFPSCAACVNTERGLYAGSLEWFSTEIAPVWRRKRATVLSALPLQEKAGEWTARELHEADPSTKQEAADTPGRANKTRDYSWGTRKSSYSRVRLIEGCGRLSINGRDGGQYLQDNPWWIHNCIAPLMELNIHRKYDVIAEVHGGGLGGQSGAIMLAVAREIVRQNPEQRLPLRRAGFLTVDARRVERKKFGLRKARKREQYSKR